MFKRAATKAASVHLLVVMSLVIGSDQFPFNSPADQKEWLLKKLSVRDIGVKEELPGYLKQVKSKIWVTIGETNVKQLLQLDVVKSANCRDGSFAKRTDICEQAKSEGISSITRYCLYKLGELAALCRNEATSSEAKPTDAPVDQVTVDFFKSLFKDTGSRKLDKSEIKELLNDVYHYHGGWMPMRNHCLVLRCSGEQSGPIGGGSETDSQQPMWSNAYDACNYYFDFRANFEDTINSGFYRPSVAVADGRSPHLAKWIIARKV